jgi:hypothetical protein
MSERLIKNKAEGNIIWRGLGGHFDSISQIINEFIDNSISNFIGYNPIIKNIVITIEEQPGREVFISIEDSGSGFKNIDSAFTLGAQDCKDSPMNEHGFGFKHALATANPDNNKWNICTRTLEQFKNGEYTQIKAAYKFENFKAYDLKVSDEKWPGQLNGSGTFMSFVCPDSLFKTVTEGFAGNFSFEKRIEFLIEDIGFIYSNLIKDDIANISIVYTDIHGSKKNKNVKAIVPEYEKFISPNNGNTLIDLDGNSIRLEYEFGAMKESEFKKYYKRNMSTSGVEIRINGRVIAYSLFKEIWGIEKHNSYNYLLIRLNLVSNQSGFLPTTRTSKNGIRKGDKKLEDLFSWVRSYMPEVKKSLKDIDHEVDLFEKLCELKNKLLPEPKTITTEQKVFQQINERISIDLYEKTTSGLTLYEGKKDFTSVQDLYQLKMYWDGCVIDKLKPDTGILIASIHPQSVKDLIVYINEMKDSNGNKYNFKLKVWNDEGIDYPPL